MKKHFFKVTVSTFITMVMVLVTSLALPCMPTQAAESDPVCWGVFVGVSEYATNPDIIYADDDARALFQALSPVWGTAHTRVLIGNVATKAAILDAISWMAANAATHDTVTFTFSGLGVAPGTICPSDFSVVGFGITTAELASAFASVRAEKILIILDCNYAGKFRVSLSKEGRVLMLSSGGGEKSEESPQYQHGVFTYFILQALSDFDTFDTDHDYELSAEEIASYAIEMTTDAVNLQHPVLDDRVTGELALLTKFVFDLNMNLPTGTTVLTLDGVDYTTPPPAQLWVPGSTHNMTVPDVVASDNGTRYIFTRWNDNNTLVTRTISKGSYVANYMLLRLLTVISGYGDTTGTGWYNDSSNASFSVTSYIETPNIRRYFTSWSGDFTGTSQNGSLIMDAPKTVTANWRTEYLLTLNSEINTPTGAGWYAEGESANISIEPIQGFLIRQVFNGWSGDLTATESSTTVTMNEPKVITATWHTDYLQLDILIAIVVVLAGGIATIIILLIRRKGAKLLVPPAVPPPPPPPSPPPPPPRARKRK